MKSLVTVEEALQILTRPLRFVNKELRSLRAALNYVLAEDLDAKVTTPSHRVSAMDGYAVQFSDMVKGAELSVIGEIKAGQRFPSQLGIGEAIRIFTGATVPEGADHILIQEHADRGGDFITVSKDQLTPRHIRQAGIDFSSGDLLIPKGERLGPSEIAVAAAANHKELNVFKQPRVALICNGDELCEPGSEMQEGQVVNSNAYALAALLDRWGAAADIKGVATDTQESIAELVKASGDADVIVPIGGASVGDYDRVKPTLASLGMDLIFEKVDFKPGKPTWYGHLASQHVLGLPGNPTSAYVCAHLFLRPLLDSLTGNTFNPLFYKARLSAPLPVNGPREAFLRAETHVDDSGVVWVTAMTQQDSSLLSPFLTCDALIRRMPRDAALDAGAVVSVIYLTKA